MSAVTTIQNSDFLTGSAEIGSANHLKALSLAIAKSLITIDLPGRVCTGLVGLAAIRGIWVTRVPMGSRSTHRLIGSIWIAGAICDSTVSLLAGFGTAAILVRNRRHTLSAVQGDEMPILKVGIIALVTAVFGAMIESDFRIAGFARGACVAATSGMLAGLAVSKVPARVDLVSSLLLVFLSFFTNFYKIGEGTTAIELAVLSGAALMGSAKTLRSGIV